MWGGSDAAETIAGIVTIQNLAKPATTSMAAMIASVRGRKRFIQSAPRLAITQTARSILFYALQREAKS